MRKFRRLYRRRNLLPTLLVSTLFLIASSLNFYQVEVDDFYLSGVPALSGQIQTSLNPSFAQNNTYTQSLSDFAITYKYNENMTGRIFGKLATIRGEVYLDKARYINTMLIRSQYPITISTQRGDITYVYGAILFARTVATPDDATTYIYVQVPYWQKLLLGGLN